MMVEGLAQPELTGVLRSRSFSHSLAHIALHTEATRLEGGFVVSRDETGFVFSPTVLAQEPDARPYYVGSYISAEGSMVLPKAPRSVMSLHTHPYLAPLGPTDFTNTEPSPDDIMHMQQRQWQCSNYIMSIVGLRPPAGLILAMRRTTRPLPQDRDELLMNYERAMTGDFDANLKERLGIKTVRIIFDLLRGRVRTPRARPPRSQSKLHEAIAPLFTE
jgi:hypothetical protein